jgi:hypothetical protein
MATKKPVRKPARKKLALGECPNPGRAYSLFELVALLKDKAFAQFFFGLLKSAGANDTAAIACVNSYLAPTEKELRDLGIPASQIDSMRRCTESGLLVIVTAQQNA